MVVWVALFAFYYFLFYTANMNSSERSFGETEANIAQFLVLAKDKFAADQERISLVTRLTQDMKAYYDKYTWMYDYNKMLKPEQSEEAEIESVSKQLIAAAKHNTVADLDILIYPHSEKQGGDVIYVLHDYGQHHDVLSHPHRVIEPSKIPNLFIVHAPEPSILIRPWGYNKLVPAEKYRLVGKNNLPKYAPELFR